MSEKEQSEGTGVPPPVQSSQPAAAIPHRPSSSHSSQSSGSSSKHVKCIGRYVLTGHNLGKGNFARVESAVHTLTRAKVAIKIIETDKIKEDYVRKNLLREAQLMRRLRHPNIIRLYETMKTNNLYCLVTEIAEGGELLSFVRNDFKEKRLPEATTRPFIRQLTSALYYLHGHGIVHRDLKMENILLDRKKRNLKIVDFGLSNAQKAGALLQTHCGSPEYAAPELFIPGRQYGSEVDVWSLGVNMYAMLVGKLPFRSPRQGTKKRQKLLEQITAGITDNHEKEMTHISTGGHDLICHLLQPDPTKRASLDDVMHHPWVTKDGTQPLVPYEYTPPDPITQNLVMELMQRVLGEPITQIKETVRRDRCDWLAAIYNLLMDQPEGRNILQRMLSNDPTDDYLNSGDDYQSTSAEHLPLSQSFYGQSQDTHQVDNSVGMLTNPSFLHKSENQRYHDYEAVSRRKHPTVDQRTLGQLRGHNNSHHHISTNYMISPHQSAHSRRRHSKELSPAHYNADMGGVKRTIRSPHEDILLYAGGSTESQTRPHSRMSAPEPLPIPFQKSIFRKQHLNHSPIGPSPIGPSPSGSPPSRTKSPIDGYIDSPHAAMRGSYKRHHGNLKPMKKTLSASFDNRLDHNWSGKNQVAPLHKQLSMEGWGSVTHKPILSDEGRPILQDEDTVISNVHAHEIDHHEMMNKHGMRQLSTSMHIDREATIPEEQLIETVKPKRVSSAKPYPPNSLFSLNRDISESAQQLGGNNPPVKNGLILPPHHKEPLPAIEGTSKGGGGDKVSPGTRKKTIVNFGGFFNRLKGASAVMKDDRTPLHVQGTAPLDNRLN